MAIATTDMIMATTAVCVYGCLFDCVYSVGVDVNMDVNVDTDMDINVDICQILTWTMTKTSRHLGSVVEL